MTGKVGFTVGDMRGVEEVLKTLGEVKPSLYSEICDRVQDEAEAIAQAVTRAMPNDAPMSGFKHSGRTSWDNKGEASASSSEKMTLGESEREWPVYRISLGGYASAVTDIAGAGSGGSSPQGANMVTVLNGRYGRASRWVWPVANRHERRIMLKMQDAAEKIEAEFTARLAKVPVVKG